MTTPKRHGVFSSALIVIAMRWTDRLIGLVSTLVLARLLLPDDFGVVAMASIMVGLVDVLLNLGVEVALIHNKEATEDDFNTAWTIRLLQTVAAAVLVYLAAPLAAHYYHDHRVLAVMQFMAINILVAGAENIGIVTFQKNMEFGRDFQFFFTKRCAGFLITLTLAFILHSYWAMVFGSLSGRIVGVITSYLMHPFRPRLSLSRFKSLWSFSQWVLARNIGGYANTRIDKFIVGGRASATVMGGYSLADEVSSMPTSELLAPLGRVLFPTFVEVREDPAQLCGTFLLALAIQALFVIPASIGIALTAQNLVFTLLGSKWSIVIPFIRILAIQQIFVTLSHAAGYALLAVGKVRTLSIVTWLQMMLLAGLAICIFPHTNAMGIAWIRVASAFFGMFLLIVMTLMHLKGLHIRDLAASVWRPLVGSTSMALFLTVLPTAQLPVVVALGVQIAGGATVYTITLLLLWRLSRLPRGAESYVLEKLMAHTRLRQ